jgi:hypothetical protein
MFRVYANDPDHAFAMDHLALVANFLDGRSDFHKFGSRSLRSREKIGWQAKAPAPQERKPLRTKVGQTLSSVNPAISAIFSQLPLFV